MTKNLIYKICFFFQVAFIHIDRQMILTIHNHVITRIPRFSITHDKHYTWSLKIQNVQQEDKGFYMCQVNTDPMVSKVGYLDVVGELYLKNVQIADQNPQFGTDFSATQILREITFRDSRSSKAVLFIILEALSFDF